MDDTLKIRVLMIYYHHWGKDEINARKTVSGLNQTIRFLQDRFQTEEYSMMEGLKRMFSYLSEDRSFVCSEFVDLFLQDVGGCFDSFLTYDDFYDEEELLFDKKVLLEENLSILSEDAGYLLYDPEFSHHNVLSVDAIVALF